MNTRTMARTTVNPAIALFLAVSLLANVALAVVALNAGGDAPAVVSQAAPAAPSALPKVYLSERSGEGLVGSTSSRSVATLKAYTHPYAGEGRSNVAALRAVTSLPLITYDAQPYMGEGSANVSALRAIDALPLITYDAPLGMGEGWVGGVSAQAEFASSALLAHTSCGQGEGLAQHRVTNANPCR